MTVLAAKFLIERTQPVASDRRNHPLLLLDRNLACQSSSRRRTSVGQPVSSLQMMLANANMTMQKTRGTSAILVVPCPARWTYPTRRLFASFLCVTQIRPTQRHCRRRRCPTALSSDKSAAAKCSRSNDDNVSTHRSGIQSRKQKNQIIAYTKHSRHTSH
mmetsp:Transcript_20625/g.44769  ORF Transcript_20625/g.44769 Transcript_20625/m.44769 type:complete len:160 (-) Transcript_20625:821-1300(-)